MMDRGFDFELVINKTEVKAGLINGNNYRLEQQIIDLGKVFSNVEEKMNKYLNEKFNSDVYRNFETCLWEKPKKTLHELINELEKLTRARRVWLEPLVWAILINEYGNEIDEVKKLKEKGLYRLDHNIIRSL